MAFTLFACAVLAGHPHGSAAGKSSSRPVIELFTSQGCNSCPPADKILGGLANGEEVIALSFAVDYWDYLGWKDTLASPENSRRQRAYSKARRDGQVYTPQIVVNGATHVVGSDGRAISQAINSTAKARAARAVDMKVWTEGNSLRIWAGGMAEEKTSSGTIWLALVTQKVPVAIKRGENAGKVIVYHKVVRDFSAVGKWSGKEITLDLPKRDLMSVGADGCTVLLQMDDAGPIIAAAEMTEW